MNRKTIIAVSAGLVGGALVTGWLSSAKPKFAKASSLVIEQRAAEGKLAAGDGIPAYKPIPFRLYSDGLVLCGQGLKPKASKQYQITTTKLSSQQMESLLSKIKTTGFGQLQNEYAPSGAKIAQQKQSLSIQTAGLNKSVAYFSMSTGKPAAYAQTEQILATICGTATKPYQSEGIYVQVSKVNAQFVSEPISQQWIPGLAEPQISHLLHLYNRNNQIAQIIVKAMKDKTHAYFKTGLGVYEVALTPRLPPVAKTTSKVSLNLSGGIALAEGQNTIQLVIFCPKAPDPCNDKSLNVERINSDVESFYYTETGEVPNMLPPKVVYGKQPADYYKQCQAASKKDCLEEDGTTKDAFSNSYDNISREIQKPGSKDIIAVVTGYDTPNSSACGWGGGNFATIRNDSGCDVSQVAAHEIGHTLGFDHRMEIPDNVMSYGCSFKQLTECHLADDQVASIKDPSNPYFQQPGADYKPPSYPPLPAELDGTETPDKSLGRRDYCTSYPGAEYCLLNPQYKSEVLSTDDCQYQTIATRGAFNYSPDSGCIEVLQRGLKQLGYEIDETGKYDAKTIEAVKKMQHDYGLNESGTTDRELWSLLTDVLSVDCQDELCHVQGSAPASTSTASAPGVGAGPDCTESGLEFTDGGYCNSYPSTNFATLQPANPGCCAFDQDLVASNPESEYCLATSSCDAATYDQSSSNCDNCATIDLNTIQGQCEYTDHPEYCDGGSYGAGNSGEAGYEGSYEGYYSIGGGPDCNNDPTLEYCQNNGLGSAEPNYESGYCCAYIQSDNPDPDSEYCFATSSCDSSFAGSEPGYESGYEANYEGSYDYCEYTDHPEYCQ